jgi:AcrR family transcriptional regulator
MATRKPRLSLKPRKQPTQARSSETVNVILEAAARILETRGFAGYTTNAVAERAGVSIGSLYQYFPNKDALTAALIDRETVPLVSALAGAAQTKSCMTGFDRLINAAVAHQMRRPELAAKPSRPARGRPHHRSGHRVVQARRCSHRGRPGTRSR